VSTAKTLSVEMDDNNGVATVTIDRPEKHNALTARFWSEFRAVLQQLEIRSATRAVVLTGAGDRAFSTGGDIAGFADLTDNAARLAFLADCQETFSALEETPLPVVAAVNGWALGGGCELALACDIVLAGENARFGMPEAGVGLVPGFGMLRAPQVIGRHWTKYLVMTGDTIDAEEARRLGMVQRIFPAARLAEEARAVAARIAGNAPLAVRYAKELANRRIERREAARGIDAVTVLYGTRDAAEGIRAFVEKRRPGFEGR
jgi:enoyl-CoA hydratase